MTSGGQCALGTCNKRTGSTRNDLGRAADLEIWRNGKALDFTKSKDLPFFANFVRACAALGATGIGAGTEYMGPRRVHVGYGKRAVWGAGGKGASAPTWLREAASSGWMLLNTSPNQPFDDSIRSMFGDGGFGGGAAGFL